MLRSLALLVSSCLLSYVSPAQLWPADGAKLNYRIIGFRFPAEGGASSYKIEIASGNYSTVDSFSKKIIKTVKTKENRVIIEVPTFATAYTWRLVAEAGSKPVKKGPLYHFTTGFNSRIDTNLLRMKILQSAATQSKDNYVGVDAGGVLYDMNGKAVWYVPDTNGVGGNDANLEFTSDGTITFLYRQGYEINYDGKVLWKSPSRAFLLNDTTQGDLFHHEFTKLKNGHFMALGMELLMCRTVSVDGKSTIQVSTNKSFEQPGYSMGRFGGIIEYDEKGNVVWSWKSSKYLLESDLAYLTPADTMRKYDAHDNAFYFDEKQKVVYVGFRNINRIIAVEYPSGKVLREYGQSYKPGEAGNATGLFCHQHSIGRTYDGYLYYFNNNSCHMSMAPTIVMLQEPENAKDDLKKVWEYTCTIEGPYVNFVSGGNAKEMADHSIFVNMGTKYSKLFIVNREKKVLWAGLPERFVESDNKWMPMHQYRSTIISRKDLEKIIWASQP